MLLIYMKRFKIIFRCSIQFICNSRCGSAQCNFYQQYVQKIHYRCQALPGKVQPCKPSRVSSINLMSYWFKTFELTGLFMKTKERRKRIPYSKITWWLWDYPFYFLSFSWVLEQVFLPCGRAGHLWMLSIFVSSQWQQLDLEI